MKLFKNYESKADLRKKLEIQIANNQIVNEKKGELSNESIKYQVKNNDNKLIIAQKDVEIEDLKAKIVQNEDCILALKKERTSLRRKNTILAKNNNVSMDVENGK